jgi:hypothetical protein
MKTGLIGQAMSKRRVAFALFIAGNVSAQDLVPGSIAAPPPEPAGANAEVDRVIVTGSIVRVSNDHDIGLVISGAGNHPRHCVVRCPQFHY